VVALTESTNPKLRGEALLVLYAIAMGPSTREGGSNFELMVPYISRLAPRLMDASAPARGMSLLLLGGMVGIRPTPPELIKAAVAVLQDPRSTQLMPDTRSKPFGNTASMGAAVLWVVLPAGASYHRDPATGITEGEDSVEVQEAIVTFLRRPDQTAESISESIRAITLAQAQNGAVNSQLVKLLDNPNVAIREALLRHITALTLTPADFAYAKGRVERIVTDADEPTELKQIASAILPCWQNDRHKLCAAQ